MLARLIIGLAMTVVAGGLAARRVLTLYRIGRLGQPADPERTRDLEPRARAVLIEVFGQRKLLKWTGAGAAHFAVFWGFLILGATIVEGYGSLFQRDFHIPLIGTDTWLGFLEDLFIVAVLCGLAAFTVIRLRQSPSRAGRSSRFSGSHLGAAWLVLFMIFNVMWTLLLYRGAQINTGYFPYRHGAFASEIAAKILHPLGHTANDVLETVGILASPRRRPWVPRAGGALQAPAHLPRPVQHRLLPGDSRALGALLPACTLAGKEVDFEDRGVYDKIGRGAIEDFTWKGLLDFATCTECGRCQSQCPAWNTEKPLSPKLLIMSLRDHALAKAPYLLASSDEERAALPEQARAEAGRPLVGPIAEGGVIDPDILWSCVTCGACVEQCPVDIEHVDHIVDMRRYQVMIESEFPREAQGMLRNLERKGDPWGRGEKARLEWTQGLPFEVRVFGNGGEEKLPEDVEYLFWVGCAGSLDDNAKKTSRAVAELLYEAGVEFHDPRQRRGRAPETCGAQAGQELLFQELAEAERGDAQRGRREEDRRHLRALLQHPVERVPAVRRELRGRTPHRTTGEARGGRQTPAGDRCEPRRHLPRPLLPRPAQPRLQPAARDPRQHPRPEPDRDAQEQGTLLLLRRRRRADVDGGDHRHAHQRDQDGRGARHRARPDHGRLPLLHRDAHGRRRDAQAAGESGGGRACHGRL